MKADGSEKKKLIEEDIGTFEVSGDWIYFSSMYGNIKKARTDGSERQRVDVE